MTYNNAFFRFYFLSCKVKQDFAPWVYILPEGPAFISIIIYKSIHHNTYNHIWRIQMPIIVSVRCYIKPRGIPLLLNTLYNLPRERRDREMTAEWKVRQTLPQAHGHIIYVSGLKTKCHPSITYKEYSQEYESLRIII